MANKDKIKEFEYKPGQSGNPSGKPKGTLSFKTIMRKWLSVEMEDENPETGKREKLPLADIIVLKQIQKARRGNDKSFEMIKNHLEALPKQGFDVTSAGEKIGEKEIVFRRYKKDDKTK